MNLSGTSTAVRHAVVLLTAAALATVGLATVTVAPASATDTDTPTVVIQQQGGGAQAFDAAPGTTVVAGYEFDPGASSATIVDNATTALTISCKNGRTPTRSSITVPIGHQEYPSSGPTWTPSDDPKDPATYQGSAVLGDYCGGTTMVVGDKMGPFSADVYSTTTTKAVKVRWHFNQQALTGSGGWSAVKSVTPEGIGGYGADLQLTKTDPADPIRPGQSLTYTLTARNPSQTVTATNVWVKDIYDPNTEFVSATGASCTKESISGVSLIACNVGSMAPGTTRPISMTFSTPSTATTDTFSGSGAQDGGLGLTCPDSDLCNRALVLSLDTKDPDTTDNSVYQPTNVIRSGITLDKTVADSNDADTIGSLGEKLTYGFKVTNTGVLPLNNVKITDAMLGLTNAPCVSSLAPGASTACPQLTAQTWTVGAADIARGSITNTASATGTPSAGTPVVASDTETISTPAVPGLALAKTVTDSNDADTIGSRGETLTYGFKVTNTGNVPLTGVTVTDAMLGLDKAACTGTLAVGASATCLGGRTWTVTTGDIGRGSVDNTAIASGTTPAGGTVDGSGAATIPTEAAAPAVVLTKTVSDSGDADQIGSLGETLTYGFSVTNTGNVPLATVTVSDPKLGLSGVTCASSVDVGATVACPQRPTYVVTGNDILAGSVSNTATANASSAGGRTAQDPDTATIATPAAPAIALVKQVADSSDPGTVANSDETLTYTFKVTNSGNVPLSNVTITDPKVGLDRAACVSSLAVGATATCPTATYTTTSDDIEDGQVVNTATANGAAPGGATVSASETARITTEAATRALTLVKTVKDSGDGDGIGSLGERLSYAFKVTNTGNVTLKDITITDALLGYSAADCAAKLVAKASTTCPLLPDRKHTVTADDIAAGAVSNTAKAAGATNGGGRATGQDTATIATPAVPAVLLTKTVRDSDDADSVGSLGEVLTYGFTVTNTGNVPLHDVQLDDPSLGVQGSPCPGTLAVGASTTCTPSSRTRTVTSGDIEAGSVGNTATGSAAAPDGSRVSDDDRATIATEAPLTGIILDKAVADSDDPDTVGSLGESLRYTFTVTNTGNVALHDVTISDPKLGMVASSCTADLAAGATTTCLGGRTHTVDSSDIDAGSVANTATATGTPTNGPAVSDDDRAVIDTPASPGLVLAKTVTDSGDADAIGSLGESLTYSFTVTNSGNQPLHDVVVDDQMLGLAGAACVTALPVGASATCLAGRTHTVTATDLGHGTVDNTATAVGTSSSGTTVRGSDTATFPTEAPLPAIALEKTARDSDDAGSTAGLGETIRYSFRVINNGNLPLTNVTISDPMLGMSGAPCVANLAVGASATCLDGKTHTVTSGEIATGSVDNTATASATAPVGGPVTGQGSASVPTDVPNPAVTLAKSVRDSDDADALGSPGETLTYAFTVTNNGNVPLTDVTISDPMLGLNGASCVATLTPGASSTCPQLSGPLTHRVSDEDVAKGSVDNAATVSARAGGTTVTDRSTASMPTPTTEPPTEDPGDPTGPFDWDWRYPAPTCTALTVTYPRDEPDGQTNDVNIRFQSNVGEFTLNFHDNEGFWSGTHSFVYRTHPRWPAGLTSYTVEWVQVAGTNYHWEDQVRCDVDSNGNVTQARSTTVIKGWRTGAITLNAPATPPSDVVDVDGFGYQSLELEQLTDGGWRWVRTVEMSASGQAQVNFPRLKEKGTYQFRLRVEASPDVTGATTDPYVVRMR